jgi:hypothetical protein
VWWKREPPALDAVTVNGIIELLMRIDARVEQLVEHFGIEDEEDEDES